MKERPINLKAWEVRAILDGRKTQFRRVVEPQPQWIRPAVGRDGVAHGYCGSGPVDGIPCPYGQLGDRLWVRETTWWRFDGVDDNKFTGCVADGSPVRSGEHQEAAADQRPHYKVPSVHMPRRASRITLEVISVRVERLDEVSEEDAKAGGVTPTDFTGYEHPDNPTLSAGAYRDGFIDTWESINGPGSWGDQWVWVVEFRQV